jgi:hypothetical protein
LVNERRFPRFGLADHGLPGKVSIKASNDGNLWRDLLFRLRTAGRHDKREKD